MEKNVGKNDRRIRIIAGFIILIVAALYSSWIWVIGVLLVLTGLIGYCAIYSLLKINTNKEKKIVSRNSKPKRKK